MEVSDVRVRLVRDANERLKAVCSVTLDNEFVVRDVKVVEGTNGLFVAMPSRKLTSACPKCRTQNHLRARSCNECGGKLPQARIPTDADGREKVHRDIAHPITAAFRQTVQQHVLDAFHDAMEEEELDRPEEEEVEVEVEVEPQHEDEGSEYDSIIADLRSGSRFEGREDKDREDKGREDKSGSESASRDSDRDRPRRQRRRRGPREDRPEEPRREPVERERASTEEKDRTSERADDEPEDNEPEESVFGANLGVSESHDERKRDKVAAPVRRSMNRPSDSFGDDSSEADSKNSDEHEEDTTSFGEGIL